MDHHAKLDWATAETCHLVNGDVNNIEKSMSCQMNMREEGMTCEANCSKLMSSLSSQSMQVHFDSQDLSSWSRKESFDMFVPPFLMSQVQYCGI